MRVKEWLKATKKHMSDRAKVLDEVDTSIDYMRQLSGGHKEASAIFCVGLEIASIRHTPYAVMYRIDLRPDLFGDLVVDDAA